MSGKYEVVYVDDRVLEVIGKWIRYRMRELDLPLEQTAEAVQLSEDILQQLIDGRRGDPYFKDQSKALARYLARSGRWPGKRTGHILSAAFGLSNSINKGLFTDIEAYVAEEEAEQAPDT